MSSWRLSAQDHARLHALLASTSLKSTNNALFKHVRAVQLVRESLLAAAVEEYKSNNIPFPPWIIPYFVLHDKVCIRQNHTAGQGCNKRSSRGGCEYSKCQCILCGSSSHGAFTRKGGAASGFDWMCPSHIAREKELARVKEGLNLPSIAAASERVEHLVAFLRAGNKLPPLEKVVASATTSAPASAPSTPPFSSSTPAGGGSAQHSRQASQDVSPAENHADDKHEDEAEEKNYDAAAAAVDMHALEQHVEGVEDDASALFDDLLGLGGTVFEAQQPSSAYAPVQSSPSPAILFPQRTQPLLLSRQHQQQQQQSQASVVSQPYLPLPQLPLFSTQHFQNVAAAAGLSFDQLMPGGHGHEDSFEYSSDGGGGQQGMNGSAAVAPSPPPPPRAVVMTKRAPTHSTPLPIFPPAPVTQASSSFPFQQLPAHVFPPASHASAPFASAQQQQYAAFAPVPPVTQQPQQFHNPFANPFAPSAAAAAPAFTAVPSEVFAPPGIAGLFAPSAAFAPAASSPAAASTAFAAAPAAAPTAAVPSPGAPLSAAGTAALVAPPPDASPVAAASKPAAYVPPHLRKKAAPATPPAADAPSSAAAAVSSEAAVAAPAALASPPPAASAAAAIPAAASIEPASAAAASAAGSSSSAGPPRALDLPCLPDARTVRVRLYMPGVDLAGKGENACGDSFEELLEDVGAPPAQIQEQPDGSSMHFSLVPPSPEQPHPPAISREQLWALAKNTPLYAYRFVPPKPVPPCKVPWTMQRLINKNLTLEDVCSMCGQTLAHKCHHPDT